MDFNWQDFRKRLPWLVVWVVLSSVLLAGTFVPNGPSADADELLVLSSGDTAWMLAATGLVLFMTPGLAFFYGGMVCHHSIISTMLQCTICLAIIGVLWVIIGFSLAFGEDAGGFIGNPWTYLWFRDVGGAPNPQFAATIPFQLYAMFQLKFAVITPALSAGGFVERVRFGPYLIYIGLYLLLVYCPVAHWVWHPQGFIHLWGVKDFAGGTVVHMTGGCAALAGAVMLGRRQVVKQGEELHPNNIPFVILGTGMLWFGWFGFNAGSELAADQVAAQAFLNTNTASAAAMFMWIVLEGMTGHKPSAVGACVGAVVGLVNITPACGYVTVGESLFIGGFGAIVSYVAIWLMRKTPIDDGLDAFASHGVGGATGCILTGVFAANVGVVHGPEGQNWDYFGFYWATIVIVALWSFVFGCIIFKSVDLLFGLRLSRDEEYMGLDQTQHNESLYDGAGLAEALQNTRRNTFKQESKDSEDDPEGLEDPVWHGDNTYLSTFQDPEDPLGPRPTPEVNVYY